MVTTQRGDGAIPVQTRKDFTSDQDVRWCPGCGDYSILAQTQKVMPDLGLARENIVFISGIGCASGLPYYMNTYGFHSIHGRAITLATGLKLTRPELSIWVTTGDGDALSIGGNHLLHVMRRNVDIQIILHNNEIYGLTKGQYSPTSAVGTRTKSSPEGSLDAPLHPVTVALGAGATFAARGLDIDSQNLPRVLLDAHAHRGTSFVEIYQNCNIFNDGIFDNFAAKDVRADRTILLEAGKPMIFGKERDKGIRLNGMQLEVVELGRNGVTAGDLLVHDPTIEDPILHIMLGRMGYPDFPVALGVIRDVIHPTYDQLMTDQADQLIRKMGEGSLQELLREGDTWTVE